VETTPGGAQVAIRLLDGSGSPAFGGYDAIAVPSSSCAAAVRHQHADVAASAGDDVLQRR
jgi:hypothetical protein